MSLKSIEIKGLRSFNTTQILNLAIPNGNPGSGLTVLVGPNNGGKSTVIEAFTALSQSGDISFTEGKRNKAAGDRVLIRTNHSSGQSKELKTVEVGGSEARWDNVSAEPLQQHIFTLPSRRAFNPYFGKVSAASRGGYASNSNLSTVRTPTRDNFYQRLFGIQNKRTEFNEVMKKVLNPVPNWYIDQADNGQYYLKFSTGNAYHNSEGLGEGLISLIFIIDALYDSEPNDIIVVDEPELSLHPSLQRKLSELFIEFAKDRQIIISTHSPYFIGWEAILNGGKVIRVNKTSDETKLFTLTEETVERLRGFLSNMNNPHILGLDAREAFFLEEQIILVEGQEDVVFYKKIAKDLNFEINGNFFGWGVGGADNMSIVAQMLKELGFKKVVGILDKNKEHLKAGLESAFPNYKFFAIPADDVRSKPARNAQAEIEGLLDNDGVIYPNYEEPIKNIFGDINITLGE